LKHTKFTMGWWAWSGGHFSLHQAMTEQEIMKEKFFVEFAKTRLRKNCFSNRVPPSWNVLPTAFKMAGTLNTFKNLLDTDKKLNSQFCCFDD